MIIVTNYIAILFIILIVRSEDKLVRTNALEDHELKFFIVNILNLNGHVCMGAHVDEYWVLTTASCATLVKDNIDDTKLSLGDAKVTAEAGVRSHAEQVRIHSKYNAQDKTDNIALIKLSEGFDMTQTGRLQDIGIAVIALATSSSEAEECILYGWSHRSFYEPSSVNTHLMDSRFTTASADECTSQLEKVGQNATSFLEDQMLCGSDRLCISDDGAPLVCNNQLHGVLSVTYCTVTILEKIEHYESWIRTNIQSKIQYETVKLEAIMETSHNTDNKVQTVKEEKELDLNAYSTKKTIAQGLIDITLLSSNAGTLNFVLKVGQMHRFYSFLLVAVGASISIQLLQTFLCLLLGRLDINKRENHTCASALNDCILYTNAILILINGFISAFELKDEYSSHAYRYIDIMARNSSNATTISNETTTWNEATIVPW
ncbi:hypothetical protein Trydic_g13645 [Trypoxylus dichotomus]